MPIGSPEFVHTFVAKKTEEILKDVDKVKVVSDPLFHFHLLHFCQITRIGYLSRNVPPPVMVNARCNVQYVDNAIVKSILQRGTKHKHGNGSLSDNWSPPVLEWYSCIVQSAWHLGGFGITPNEASGITAYYSATAQFVKWTGQLSQPSTWANGQDPSSPQDMALPQPAHAHSHAYTLDPGISVCRALSR